MGQISMPCISQRYFVVFLSWHLLYMLSPAPSSLRDFLSFHKAGPPPFPLPSETHILFWLLLSMCSPSPIILSIKPLSPLTRDRPVAHPHVVTFKDFYFVWSVCDMTTYILNYLLWKNQKVLFCFYYIYIYTYMYMYKCSFLWLLLHSQCCNY